MEDHNDAPLAGIDIVTISRRFGHAGPNMTFAVYSPAFRDKPNTSAAEAIARALGSKRVPNGDTRP